MHNPTSIGAGATPAAGSRHVGMHRRITAALRGEVICDECGTAFDTDHCPTCAQRRRRRAGLETVIECYGGDRLYITVDRSDVADGTSDPWVEDGELEGWPW